MSESCYICGRTPKGNSEYSTDYLEPMHDDAAGIILVGRKCAIQLEKIQDGLITMDDIEGASEIGVPVGTRCINWKAYALYLRNLQVDTALGRRGNTRGRK